MIDDDFIKRCRARMAWVDSLSPGMRQLVNEHGQTIIQALWDVGVRKPGRVAHIIEVFARSGIYGNGKGSGSPR